ncbi:hypothetical protein GQ600_1777 [Phytophthora cactorum]|nr:hypothetical protein GQ600_1777 [Phytophthora cactorum]
MNLLSSARPSVSRPFARAQVVACSANFIAKLLLLIQISTRIAYASRKTLGWGKPAVAGRVAIVPVERNPNGLTRSAPVKPDQDRTRVGLRLVGQTPRRILAPGAAPAGGLDAVRAVLGTTHDPHHPSAVVGTPPTHAAQPHEHTCSPERLRLVGYLFASPHVVVDLVPAESACSPSRGRPPPPQPAAAAIVCTRCFDGAVHHPVSSVREHCSVGAYDHEHDPAAETKPQPKKKRKTRICKSEGCEKYVVDRGLCIRHGGGKRCSVEDCNCRAQNRGLCWKHGGYTRCTVEGCTKRAKSRGICWSHGGGTRCKHGGCSKIAVSHGLCWAHGGGKRCLVETCQKPAYERNGNLCAEHCAQRTQQQAAAAAAAPAPVAN